MNVAQRIWDRNPDGLFIPDDLDALGAVVLAHATEDMALVRKKFDGGLTKSDGTRDIMQWQTLYYCRLHEGRWKICGFTGYLPNPMG